ncbi:MAG: isoleucine--tRNA ligase, partial [Actinomycetota bacterium]|nr:isoleucine--tRNA ligase [Actinomycetota bacterium]
MTYPRVSPDAPVDAPVDGAAAGVPATLAQNPNFPQLEERVLAYWEADDTFRASVEQRDAGTNGDNEFVFYDGPPFANGLPHYGHLLTGYVKDLIPRYQTMRGRRVERRFGWDTHGLPAELEAMRQLGMKTTDEILELGIEQFNAECRKSVFEYTQEWRDYVTRQARWVDFDNDYKTLDLDYMESVMWAFKQLHDKGLAYEGFRVLPYCWNDETPLSTHELRMDEDVYQQRQDPAVTVGCRLDGTDSLGGAIALVWTTTPWTLPSNLLIMVGADIEYVVVESDFTGTTERYVVGAARLAAYARELKDERSESVEDQVVERLTGRDLLGRGYTPPFSYFLGHPHSHRVVEADFVTTEDGTGLVHSAGAFGEEDKVITDREGIELIVAVAKDGTFTHPIDDYEGLHVFDANLAIIEHLKAATRVSTGSTTERAATGSVTPGTVLLRRESYEHPYPHCWRCDTALLYYALPSWYIRTTAIKDRLLEENAKTDWHPATIKTGRYGDWLNNNIDWALSRNRYWGTPLPVWRCTADNDHWLAVGSLKELGELAGQELSSLDPHRPYVDDVVVPCNTCGAESRRVPEVIDGWYDSGSMPFAQVGYPWSGVEPAYPAQFICEAIDQTRGWFYTLMAVGTLVFDQSSYETVLCLGHLVDKTGRKMSKHLGNVLDPFDLMERHGADAVRWFMLCGGSPWSSRRVSHEALDEGVRKVLLT